MLQGDAELVREFVCSDGLACLVTVASDAHNTYQSYVLRGQYTSALQHWSVGGNDVNMTKFLRPRPK